MGLAPSSSYKCHTYWVGVGYNLVLLLTILYCQRRGKRYKNCEERMMSTFFLLFLIFFFCFWLCFHCVLVVQCSLRTVFDWLPQLKEFRACFFAGAKDHSDFVQQLASLELCFQMSVKDLRSQVVREACITIAWVFPPFAAAAVLELYVWNPWGLPWDCMEIYITVVILWFSSSDQS